MKKNSYSFINPVPTFDGQEDYDDINQIVMQKKASN